MNKQILERLYTGYAPKSIVFISVLLLSTEAECSLIDVPNGAPVRHLAAAASSPMVMVLGGLFSLQLVTAMVSCCVAAIWLRTKSEDDFAERYELEVPKQRRFAPRRSLRRDLYELDIADWQHEVQRQDHRREIQQHNWHLMERHAEIVPPEPTPVVTLKKGGKKKEKTPLEEHADAEKRKTP